MKRMMKNLGSILLVLCLIAALIPGAAFAVGDGYYSANWTGTQGSYCDWYWTAPDGLPIGRAYVEDGMLPDGIYLTVTSDGQMNAYGTPASSGTYDARIHMDTVNDTYYLDVLIEIEAQSSKDVQYCTDAVYDTVGQALSGWSWGTPNGENIGDLYVSSGSLPNGLYTVTGSNAFQICGTPTTTGDGYFTIYIDTFDTTYYLQCSYTIAAAQQQFVITKSPSGENTQEGGQATFIASATGYSYVDWLLISGGNVVGTYRGESNTSYGQCTVITYKNNDKEYLVLRNIPANMNGYMVQARFTNSSGVSITTQSCSLYVQATATPSPTVTPAADLKAPTITLQPSAVTQTVGNNTVLSVAASDPNGGTLSYQWYSNTAATSTGATAINGANQSSYAAPQTVGTIYYYCSVTSTKDGKTSPAANTTPVAVTYSDSSTPSASASPAVSPSASPSVTPTPTPSSTTKGEGHSSTLMILLIVLIVIAAACLVCQIIYISKKNKGEAVPLVKWDCPQCGAHNKAGSRFCSECGTKNPRLKVKTKE